MGFITAEVFAENCIYTIKLQKKKKKRKRVSFIDKN